MEGDWDTFQGQVFTAWRREKHVVKPVALDIAAMNPKNKRG